MENEIKEISVFELKKLIKKLVVTGLNYHNDIKNKKYKNCILGNNITDTYEQLSLIIDKRYINIKFFLEVRGKLQCNFRDKTDKYFNDHIVFESKKYESDDICTIIKLVDKIIENIENSNNKIKNILENYEEELNNQNHSNNIKNIILYGPPGVGKTYITKKLISMIESKMPIYDIFETISKYSCDEYDDSNYPEDRVRFITFHQSYSYEEFIEGLRPQEDNSVKPEDGVFKKFCESAKTDPDKDKNYYFIIDEINRGNISKIFGELITLIEEDKRDKYKVKLPYSKKPFSVPSNLYIIGTMNSTDKSIALIDTALRRRFTFVKIEPNPGLLVDNNDARELMESLNKKIREKLGEDYLIGHSYFMNIDSEKELEFIKNYKLKPLLEEYFYNDKSSYDEMVKILERSENE